MAMNGDKSAIGEAVCSTCNGMDEVDICDRCDNDFGLSGKDSNGFNSSCVHCGNNTYTTKPCPDCEGGKNSSAVPAEPSKTEQGQPPERIWINQLPTHGSVLAFTTPALAVTAMSVEYVRADTFAAAPSQQVWDEAMEIAASAVPQYRNSPSSLRFGIIAELESAKAKSLAAAPSSDEKETARLLIIQFMNTISEGEGDYSCNECELNTYLCPHLFERLQGMIAAALTTTPRNEDKKSE